MVPLFLQNVDPSEGGYDPRHEKIALKRGGKRARSCANRLKIHRRTSTLESVIFLRNLNPAIARAVTASSHGELKGTMTARQSANPTQWFPGVYQWKEAIDQEQEAKSHLLSGSQVRSEIKAED